VYTAAGGAVAVPAGLVTATLVTAGGHGRWDLDELREQLRALRRRDE
jgi:hypothetical protein